MTTPSPPPDDAPHDAHLRAALRHAPDRDMQPGEAVSAHIVRAAHAAAAQAAPAPERAPPAAWLVRVRALLHALRRPGPSAAFASLALATVIGVMWRDGLRPEDRADSRFAHTERAAAPPQATAASEAARPEAMADAAAARVAPDDRTATPRPRARTEPAPPPTAPNAPRLAPPAPAPAPAPAENAEKAEAESEATSSRRDDRAAPPGAAAPPPPLAPAEAPATAEAPAAARSAARNAAPGAVPPADAGAPSGALGRSPATAAPPPDPLAPLAAAWAGTGTDASAAIDTLRQLTQGRWRRALAPLPLDGAVPVTGPGGGLQGALHLSEGRVLWRATGPGEALWEAPLPAGAAARLRPALGFAPPSASRP